ncbi:transposase [Leisingera sp.]|uniref:transposase n=1 Tax=Leisingera sp. TaxID=1879318 RepID=UPI003A5C39B6
MANASEYNESLRQRGDVAVWLSNDVAEFWASSHCKTRGGQARYSDLAIEVFVTLRVVLAVSQRLV